MTEPHYRISHSGAVSDQLRAVFARAEAEGVGRVTARAARWAIEEMERTPLEFGESREYWPHAELLTRIAFVPPLYIIYGVHEPSRTVFIGRIGWLNRA